LEKLDLKLNNITSLEVLHFLPLLLLKKKKRHLYFFKLLALLSDVLCMLHQGLRSCANLKWLSVVENKLESLEGIQGLTKLTVSCFGFYFVTF